MIEIALLKHVSFEGPGAIADWAEARGHALRVVHLGRGEALPGVGDFDALIVMGGPMGVADEAAFPWLTGEKRLVAAAVDAGRPVLGVCLGAQILASALGAPVFANAHKEIGWHEIVWSAEARALGPFRHMPARETVFHWHGDTFDLPKGAVALASSAVCRCQGFAARGGRVVGLQFHLEMRPADVASLVDASRQELAAGGPHVQHADEILKEAPERCDGLGPQLFRFLDEWAASGEA